MSTPKPSPGKDSFLKLSGVTKRYDKHLAVNGVSLSIPKGSIYGLLGPNGAGKTSIIRMITGITAPDEGDIFFDGQTWNRSHTRQIGYMPEERGLYKKMKVREQISYLLQLKGLSLKDARSRADEWLEKFELAEWANHKAADLSKGMQQKVQFIATVAHEPSLLILDEPFSGLDPVNTRVIESEIHRMRNNGTTIIFSTHRMEQVEELCDHIALINHGELMLEDETLKVRRQFQEDIYHILIDGDISKMPPIPQAEVLEQQANQIMVRLAEGSNSRNLLRHLADIPQDVMSVSLHIPRLNEIFITLVEKK